MNNFDIKATLSLALLAAGVLAIVIMWVPRDQASMAGAVLCLWACGLLAGMSWQVLICRKHDHAPADTRDTK